MATRLKEPTVEDALNEQPVAPPSYQAEVLRGQICDDINRRFWVARQKLNRVMEGRKDQIQHDHEKLTADEFLSKYNDWRFL